MVEAGEVNDPSSLVRRVLEHDLALQLGFTLTYNDVTQLEFLGLAILKEERERHGQVVDRRREIMAEARANMKMSSF